MSEPISREYSMDDMLLLERAQVFHNGFIIDKAIFEADYPHLADPFAANFQAAIDAADAIPSGREYDTEIADKTAELNSKLPLGQKALRKLYSYVDLAWGTKTKENRFGKDRFNAARNSQVKLKELLELGYRQSEIPEQKAALLAVGYTQVGIDELQTISNDIDTLNAEQEDMLAARGDRTQLRIEAFNTVFDFMHQLNRASKIVFEDNPAKLDFYLLYPTASESLPKPQNLQMSPDPQDPQTAVLTWDPVQGATDYRVYFSETGLGAPSGNFGDIGNSEGATIFNAPIMPNRENYWKIKATGGGLSSAFSDTVQWTG